MNFTQPKHTTFNKRSKMVNRGLSKRASVVKFGQYGLQAITRGIITAKQIEAMRKALSRKFKKLGKVFIRVFPDKPISQKPINVRMGKGKGPVEYWGMFIKPGRIICEVSQVSKQEAYRALLSSSYKLPFKTKVIDKLPDVYSCL